MGRGHLGRCPGHAARIIGCSMLLLVPTVSAVTANKIMTGQEDEGCSGYRGSTCDECTDGRVSPCPNVCSGGNCPRSCSSDCVKPASATHERRADTEQTCCYDTPMVPSCDASCDDSCDDWIGLGDCDHGCDDSCDQCTTGGWRCSCDAGCDGSCDDWAGLGSCDHLCDDSCDMCHGSCTSTCTCSTAYPTAFPTTAFPTVFPTAFPTFPTGYPTTWPTGEQSHCKYLGNYCWRSRYADANNYYGNNDRCTMWLPAAAYSIIHVYRFNTEAVHDRLIVDGVSFSGTVGPTNRVVRNSLTWSSDGSVVRSGWHICLIPVTGYPTMYPTAPTGFPTLYPTSPTSWPTSFPASPTPSPTEFPTSPTGFPSGFPTNTGFPSRHPSGYPTGFPSRAAGPPTPGPVQLVGCHARGGPYTVDGVQRNSPCFLNGGARHVDYVDAHGTTARLYTCSKGTGHHFVLCTCSGATCAGNEEPRTCFVAANNGMGCVGALRGAVFSSDGMKAFFACNKEVRVCNVHLSNRNGQWYSGCQAIQNAGCPRWAAIRGVAARARPGRGDLLTVVCTDWKTRACSLHTDNMQMQPGRQCVKGGRETLCNGIGKPTALAFSSAARLITSCDTGYTYSRFVGGIITDPVHTAYNGLAPCPAETKAIVQLDSVRAVLACGTDMVHECLLAYS